MNKRISIFIITLFLVISTFSISTNEANSTGPVVEVGPNVVTNISNTVWTRVKDDVLLPIARSLASRVLSKITDDTLRWANGGFDGDPSFINNWDDYLKGIEHEAFTGAFNIANDEFNLINESTQNKYKEEYESCISLANVLHGPAPQCNTTESELDNAKKESDSCFDAIGFCDFDIDPDCDDILSEEKDSCNNILFIAEQNHNLCLSQNLDYKNAIEECGPNLVRQGVTAGLDALSGLAQDNYNKFNNIEVQNTRNSARIIAETGSKKLNVNNLESVIKNKDRTLESITGGLQQSNIAKTDLKSLGANGHAYLLALVNPSNYESGTKQLLQKTLGNETTSKISSVVEDIQTPVKFLDKKECSDGSKPKNGKCPEGTRLETTTPAGQVTEKLNKALIKDQEDPSFFSDSFIGPLISAIGSISEGVLSAGVSKLTSTVSKSFFRPDEDTSSAFSTENINEFDLNRSQSEFDVLGIKSNPSDELVSSTDPNNNESGLFSQEEEDRSFIGGPEDLSDSNLSTRPQITINLKENLEDNIILAEEELKYYRDSEDILRESKRTAIQLDRCLPGPDHGWEERYKDSFDTFTNEEDQLGLRETKDMINDPLVNIPGANTIRNTFDQLIGGTQNETAIIQQRVETLSSVISNLKFLSQNINEQFNIYKNDLNMPSLILSKKDWANLSPSEKSININYVTSGFIKKSGEQSIPYLILKEEENETIENILEINENKVMESVLSMSWDIWRDRTKKEDKQDLRYAYYIEQNNLSNEELIARAKANRNRISNGSTESNKLLTDCLILKAYALGASEQELRTATNSGTQQEINSNINELIPPIPNRFAGKGFHFVQVPEPHKTNRNIKEFLESEYQKNNDADPNTSSLFTTNAIASPAAVVSSILKFNNSNKETVSIQIDDGTETTLPNFEDQELSETEAYFQTYYPDYGLKDIQKNSYEIKDIFVKDKFYSGFDRARGERGILYCRNPRVGDLDRTGLFESSRNDLQPECIRSKWYTASNLDYETIFAGI